MAGRVDLALARVAFYEQPFRALRNGITFSHMHRLALALALVSTGCSVTLQKKPTSGNVASSSCSTTSAYWIADAVGVGVGIAGLGTGIALGQSDNDAGYLIAGIAGLASVVYLASASNGRKWARECSEPAPSIATR